MVETWNKNNKLVLVNREPIAYIDEKDVVYYNQYDYAWMVL